MACAANQTQAEQPPNPGGTRARAGAVPAHPAARRTVVKLCKAPQAKGRNTGQGLALAACRMRFQAVFSVVEAGRSRSPIRILDSQDGEALPAKRAGTGAVVMREERLMRGTKGQTAHLASATSCVAKKAVPSQRANAIARQCRLQALAPYETAWQRRRPVYEHDLQSCRESTTCRIIWIIWCRGCRARDGGSLAQSIVPGIREVNHGHALSRHHGDRANTDG